MFSSALVSRLKIGVEAFGLIYGTAVTTHVYPIKELSYDR